MYVVLLRETATLTIAADITRLENLALASGDTTLTAEFNKLSDPDVIKDFFVEASGQRMISISGQDMSVSGSDRMPDDGAAGDPGQERTTAELTCGFHSIGPPGPRRSGMARLYALCFAPTIEMMWRTARH